MPKFSFEAKLGQLQSGKQLPYLTDYLEAKRRSQSSNGKLVMLGFLATIGGVVGVQAVLQLFMAWFLALILNFVVALPFLISLVVWLINRAIQPRSSKDKRLKEVRDACNEMHELQQKRKLAKSLGTAASSLLEESARNYHRAMTSLNGPFWTDENLPTHWQEVRKQSILALDDGMDDLLLLGKQAIKPTSNKADWTEAVGAFVDGVLGIDAPKPAEPLPPGFEPARMIADKIKQLSNEVESATTKVFKEQSETSPFPSASSLDRTLSEFKTVNEAEEELDQELRQ